MDRMIFMGQLFVAQASLSQAIAIILKITFV